MSMQTCNWCGEGSDAELGPVVERNENDAMHDECWAAYNDHRARNEQ